MRTNYRILALCVLPPAAWPRPASPSAQRLRQGRASFSIDPTPVQLRFLVYILARHAPTATAFREVKVPFSYLFGPLPPESAYKAVKRIFGAGSPLLIISEIDAAGELVAKGNYCLMPFLSSLSYKEGEKVVYGKLNSCLIDFLPQFLDLLQPAIATLADQQPRPRRLAA